MQNQTLTKPEVCKLLGKSKRTVEYMVKQGRLHIAYVQGPNGRTGSFERAEVEALKRELETPIYRATPVPLALATTPHGPIRGNFPEHPTISQNVPSGDPFAGLAAHLAQLSRAYPAPPRKLWLTLDEAVAFSGLPARYLVERAATVGVNVGTEKRVSWRFSREALRALRP